MSLEVSDNEFESVNALHSADRYTYAIKRMVDFEEVWSLSGSEGWVLGTDQGGNECVPVWPARRYAEACVTKECEGPKAEAIPLTDWLNDWLPAIIKANRLIAIFPTPESKGIVVTPKRLQSDFERELEKY